MTFAVVGFVCFAIGFLAADAWMANGRGWRTFGVGERDRAVLALAVAGVYGVLHLIG